MQKDFARCNRFLYKVKYIIISIILALYSCLPSFSQSADSEKLGMAIEYFQSGKYSEALLLFTAIEKKHSLNARFKAYIGVCYYYQWQYDKAAEYLTAAIPQLDKFAPHEVSFYCYSCGESLFNIGDYTNALQYYTKMLSLCYDNEKPDAYYRIGFIHMFKQEWIDALDNFQSSLVYYQQYKPSEKARIIQIRNMINGCVEKIEKTQ